MAVMTKIMVWIVADADCAYIYGVCVCVCVCASVCVLMTSQESVIVISHI